METDMRNIKSQRNAWGLQNKKTGRISAYSFATRREAVVQAYDDERPVKVTVTARNQ
jgi:hypothetical protein